MAASGVADEPLPDAFWTKATEVTVRAGKRKRIQVQFLPFYPGEHTCQLVFLDEHSGEFVYEVKGDAVLPEPSQHLRFIADMKTAVMKDVRIPPLNARVKAANATALERLERKARTQAVRLLHNFMLCDRCPSDMSILLL